MSEAQLGEKSIFWKGGHEHYWHSVAFKLFGKEKCELCKKSDEEVTQKVKQRFSMHCTSNPKDYTLMVPENWKTLCRKCHGKIEKSKE
jgi:hypothetical protein